jgi:predicted transcriptional regulator
MSYTNKKIEAQILLSQDIPQIRVAELLKISRKTVSRWLKEPHFKDAIISGRRTQLESALARNLPTSSDDVEQTGSSTSRKQDLSLSEKLIAKSFATLDELLSNPELRASDRLKAVEIVLRQCGGSAVANFGLKVLEQRPQNNVDNLIAQRENLRARMKTLESRRDRIAET